MISSCRAPNPVGGFFFVFAVEVKNNLSIYKLGTSKNSLENNLWKYEFENIGAQ